MDTMNISSLGRSCAKPPCFFFRVLNGSMPDVFWDIFGIFWEITHSYNYVKVFQVAHFGTQEVGLDRGQVACGEQAEEPRWDPRLEVWRCRHLT